MNLTAHLKTVSEIIPIFRLNHQDEILHILNIPKTISQIMWSQISIGNIFTCYSKKKNRDNTEDWILAIIYPTANDYVCTQYKLSTESLKSVEELYSHIFDLENTQGLDAAEKYLNQYIKSLGHDSYKTFMTNRLEIELTHINEKNRTNHEMNNHFQNILQNPMGFVELVNSCQLGKKSIKETYSKVNFLSVNMSIAAHKLGKEGSTLGVVANTFQSTSENILAHFEKFQKNVEIVSIDQSDILFKVIIIKFLVDSMQNQLASNEDRNNLGNQKTISEFKKIFSDSLKSQNVFLEHLLQIEKNVQTIRTAMTRLDLIRTGGRLEGSRTSEISKTFMPFVNDMSWFIKTMNKPMSDISIEVKKTIERMEALSHSMVKIENSLFDSIAVVRLSEHFLKKQVS